MVEEVGRNQGEALVQLSGAKSSIALPTQSHFVDVPHVRQQFHWDCGLACVLMVLRTLRKWDCNIHDLMELCHSTSVWTVDLAYLLKRFSVSFRFFTIMMGANPNFSSEIFYMEQLQNDQWRVNRLFEKALEAGVSIECRSFSGEEIAALICSGNCIAVVLVDKFKLRQSVSTKGWVHLSWKFRLYGALCCSVWLRCRYQ